MSINYNPGIVRSGLITYLDAANPKSFSPNVHPNPTDIFAWCGSVGVNTGSTLRDTSVTDSPVKGVPLKLTSTGTDCYVASYNSSTWNITPAVSGQTWTVSFYAKANVATTSLPDIVPTIDPAGSASLGTGSASSIHNEHVSLDPL